MSDRFDKKINLNFGSQIPKTFKGKEWHWIHNNVFCDEKPSNDIDSFETYTKEEFDSLVINKATKAIPTEDNNIALLNDTDGDLVDSGVQIEDLKFNIIDNGVF